MIAKAYAQLVRLPNVFTVWADVLMAWCLLPAHARLPVPVLLGTIVASTAFYWGGMVLNDVADEVEDRRERPHRPIPSGRVSSRRAKGLGWGLLTIGLVLSLFLSSFGPNFWIGPLLAAAILGYNFWAKATMFGPLLLAFCRGLNVLLLAASLPELPPPLVLAAGMVATYTLGVSIFARSEATQSRVETLLVGAAFMHVSMALVGGLALLNRTWLAACWLLSYLGMVAPWQWLALRRLDSHSVQMAVKASILGLIGLDAVLASAYIVPAGLAILALLPPALLLGRWVYST